MKNSTFSRTHLDILFAVVLLTVLLFTGCDSSSSDSETNDLVGDDENLSQLATLGRRLYFDENLSNPVGQSCASCHLPDSGFADPDAHFPVSEGAISGRFGARNTPTASYAAFIPEFRFVVDRNGGHYEGGQFLDGRASSLELQAEGPFLNGLEMNMVDKSAVIQQVQNSSYADEFTDLFGENAFADVDQAYQQITEAIAEFERSQVFAPFNSRFDAVQAGTEVFTTSEQNGRNLFNGRANCDRCHDAGPDQVFSDFEYHNIGVPANPDNPFLALSVDLNPDGNSFVDNGLGGVVNEVAQNGKFRTPTLRNVALTSPYMHNGVFDSLEAVVEFYNRRDVDGVIPEVAQNVDNARNIGNLNLNPSQIQDLVAFLHSLSDR
ncbi:MAG: cytochrome-c peroxidase [Gammaproteobacteria bacterium]|nr:cytochrome-c peroxidase [Gammaproteobacteria bacterium]